MNWLSAFLTSSIGRKAVMSLTGLSLIAFLTVHCSINACIFLNDGGDTFNQAAHFMGSNFFIRAAEVGLFAGILLHIVQGLLLWADKRKRRPVAYEVQAGGATSAWYSRSMADTPEMVGVDTIKILRREKVRVLASASEIASPSPSTSSG